MKVWLNGTFVDRDEVRVSLFDAGLQHAVGLFETLAVRHGRAFRAATHANRLAGSAKDLMLTDRLRIDPLVEAIEQTIKENELQDARVRLTVTGGDLNMLQSRGQGHVDPSISVVAQPPTVYPDKFFSEGVRVAVAEGRLNPFEPTAGHKTLNYWPRLMALQAAASQQAGEALWFSVTNHIAGGSVSNVFLVRDGVLLTPIARGEEETSAIPSCVLPGVTRAAIIDLAEEAGHEVERQMLDVELLLGADEVFLTNSSWGVLPVIGVEASDIGPGAVGPVATSLREKWSELVDHECGG